MTPLVVVTLLSLAPDQFPPRQHNTQQSSTPRPGMGLL